MRFIILLLIGLAATTTPVHAQGLSKSECDEVRRTLPGSFYAR